MSDTPRTDEHYKQIYDEGLGLEYCETQLRYWAEKLEQELAKAQEEAERYRWLRDNLYNVQIGLERELAEAQEELNDKRKFCYDVEQALDGMKGDYVEIISALRKDAAIRKGEKESLTVEARKPVPEFELIEKWEGE